MSEPTEINGLFLHRVDARPLLQAGVGADRCVFCQKGVPRIRAGRRGRAPIEREDSGMTCVVCGEEITSGMLCKRCEKSRVQYVLGHDHTPAKAIRWAAPRARRYERAKWMRRKEAWAKRVRDLEMQVETVRSELMDQTRRDDIWRADFRKERARIDAVIARLSQEGNTNECSP